MSRSGFEDKHIEALKKEKTKFWYEASKVPYIVEANYIPDIILDPNNKLKGSKKRSLTLKDLEGMVLVELKGRFTSQDRRKMKAVKKANPKLDIRFVFQRDNFLTKAKKGTYTSWAKQNGFDYHVGYTIPDKWKGK